MAGAGAGEADSDVPLADSRRGFALPDRWADVFADVEAGLAAGLGRAGLEVDRVSFDGLCEVAERGCEDGGVSRLMTFSEPRGSSESALRLGGAGAGEGGGATDFGFSPVICARRSPI